MTQPRCPLWLDADAKGKWKQLAPKLSRAGILSSVDGDALAAYCQAWSRWKEAEEYLQKNGSVLAIKGDAGKVKYLQQVPQVGIAKGLLQVLLRYQNEFGITPASRSNVTVTHPHRATGSKARFFA